MDLSVKVTGQDLAKLKSLVNENNMTVNQGRVAKNELGRDDFLSILLTQLTHQDPTAPMQDRDFIAQMAQFSSLEQISNMSQEFMKLSGMMAKSQAVSMIGKSVEVISGESVVKGRVTGVTGGDYPQIIVNGRRYDYADVQTVLE